MLSSLQHAEQRLSQGDLLHAESLYRALLKQNKHNGAAYLGLGNIAFELLQFDKAVALFTQTCHLMPDSFIPLLKLAKAFNAVCAEQDALIALNYAHTTFPDSALVSYHLALQHIMLGHFDMAEKALRSILCSNTGPLVSHALFELVRMKRNTPEDNIVVNQRLRDKKQSQSELTVLHYALGNICHEQESYAMAWQYLCQANQLQMQSCQFSTTELKTFYQDIKTATTSTKLTQRHTSSDNEITPIFIVGLPRTGSTLLEQTLARHPQIAAAGELPYLSREVNLYLSQQTGKHYPYYLGELSQQQLEQAAKIYLAAIKPHGRNKPFVIDKLPANFQSIALIYCLFPKAKIIHIKRQPAAVAFSVFKNYFAENEPYFCSLTEFKHYQDYCQDLMRHWHRKFNHFIYAVDYEQIIAQKKQTIQSLLAFCGLDWDNACISNSHLNMPISTLSNVQVREAVTHFPKNDWRHYKTHLADFLA